jgi:predicted MFS family arabinose efflux permease
MSNMTHQAVISAPNRPEFKAWWMAAVLGFAGLTSYIARLILSSFLDPVRHELGITDSEVSLLQGAAFAIVYAVAAVPIARIADSHNRVRILITSGLVWSMGVLACGFASTFWSFFACRLLVGIGEAALIPAGVSMLADVFPAERRGVAIGILMTGCALGVPACYALGGVLLGFADQGTFTHVPVLGRVTPWRQVLLIIGVASLVVPLLLLSVREPIRVSSGDLGRSIRATAAQFLRLRKTLLPLYLGIALVAVGDFAVYSWLPTLLSRKFYLLPKTVGLWFGTVDGVASVIGMALGGVASDWAARRSGLRARLTLSAVAAGLALIGSLLISGSSAGVALSGLGVWVLFASGFAFTSAYVAIQTMIPAEHRALGLALVAFCNMLLGLGLGPTLVALVTDKAFGDPVAVGFAITAITLPAGALASALFFYVASALRHSAPLQVTTARG